MLKTFGGSYEIDACAHVLFPKATPPPSRNTPAGSPLTREAAVEATRREVNRAAQIAIACARHEQHNLRAAREQARRLCRLLTTIVKHSGWLPPGDAAEIASDMEAGFKGPEATSVIGLLVPTIENINEACLLAAELRRFDITPSPPSRSDPLARYFVEAMAETYTAHLLDPPPRGRSGPFVNLLVAAWRDLRFPEPLRDTPLQDWLGRKVEALPVLTTKIPDQTG